MKLFAVDLIGRFVLMWMLLTSFGSMPSLPRTFCVGMVTGLFMSWAEFIDSRKRR